MAWRLRAQLRQAPGDVDAVADALEEFEARMREATAAPRGNAMNAALTWPVHKLHFEKNRFLHDARYVHKTIDDGLLKYLVKVKVADGALLAKWRKPGYDSVCSMAVLTKSNTNFGTVGICRTPLKDRSGQIMPNVQTGCVCCVSGSGGPIWWDDPVPDIVKEQILEVDPGKAHLFEEGQEGAGEGDAVAGDNAAKEQARETEAQGGGNDTAEDRHVFAGGESDDADCAVDVPTDGATASVGAKRSLKPRDSAPSGIASSSGGADGGDHDGSNQREPSDAVRASEAEDEPAVKKSRQDDT